MQREVQKGGFTETQSGKIQFDFPDSVGKDSETQLEIAALQKNFADVYAELTKLGALADRQVATEAQIHDIFEWKGKQVGEIAFSENIYTRPVIIRKCSQHQIWLERTRPT